MSEINSSQIQEAINQDIRSLTYDLVMCLSLKDCCRAIHNFLHRHLQIKCVELRITDIEKSTSDFISVPEKCMPDELRAEALQKLNKELSLNIMSLNDTHLATIQILPDQHQRGVLIMYREGINYSSPEIDALKDLVPLLCISINNAFAQEKLGRLKQRVESSEMHEQQFLANMSHEIRTPMNAVLGMTNLLLDFEHDPKKINYLQAIQRSSENLLVIINDILDLSKLEAGKLEIENIPFRLDEVVQTVMDTFRFKAEEKGLVLEEVIDERIPNWLMGDPSRLIQVLVNLFANAVKFTDKGQVSLIVEQGNNGEVVFKVMDTGIGIKVESQNLLFDNFKQLEASTFRKYGGTGLGLSICKSLIEMQGGRIEVESTFGKGSTFSCIVPFKPAPQELIDQVAKPADEDYSSLNGIKVLLAEDNEYNQIVVNDTLENLISRVRIDIAENGLDAIDMFDPGKYDVILMDVQMPEMDGFEASRRIRQIEGTEKRTPIIALTASVLKADLERCSEAGMDAYVPKPFTRSELLGTLSQFYANEAVPEPESLKPQLIPNYERDPDSITDLSYLRELTGDSQEKMKKYIGIYLQQTPRNLEELERAIENEDIRTISRVVHTMKPHLAYMGMSATGELVLEIEKTLKGESNLEEVLPLLERLREDCNKSADELGRFSV